MYKCPRYIIWSVCWAATVCDGLLPAHKVHYRTCSPYLPSSNKKEKKGEKQVNDADPIIYIGKKDAICPKDKFVRMCLMCAAVAFLGTVDTTVLYL